MNSSALGMLLVLGGCATDSPAKTDFDDSLGEYRVEVLGDGFVRLDGERVPLEAAVLTLRLRMRGLSVAERKRVVFLLSADPDGGDAARHEIDRMLGQLQIMGAVQVRLR